MKVTFELRPEVEDFQGGTVSLPEGEAYDVGKALKEGKGKITIDPEPHGEGEEEVARAAHDAAVLNALAAFPDLQPTTSAAPKGERASASEED